MINMSCITAFTMLHSPKTGMKQFYVALSTICINRLIITWRWIQQAWFKMFRMHFWACAQCSYDGLRFHHDPLLARIMPLLKITKIIIRVTIYVPHYVHHNPKVSWQMLHDEIAWISFLAEQFLKKLQPRDTKCT